MSQVTFRFPSKKIQYGYAETTFDAMGLSDEALGEMYARATLAFQEGEINEFNKMEQAARGLIQTELGGKVISEEETPDVDHQPEQPGEAETTGKPWESAAPKAAAKPWEAPSFNFGS